MIDKNSKYCLFFDWDGTLCPKSTVSEENRQALLKLKEAGHYLVLNTGRSREHIPSEAFSLIEWDGIIAGMSYIEFRGEILADEHMSKKALLDLKRFYDKNHIRCFLQGVVKSYTLGYPDSGRDVTENYEGFICDNYDTLNITKATIADDITGLEANEFDGCWTICHTGSNKYSEVVLKGFDKSTGIKMISERLGIPREHTVAFGDSYNDIDMLKYAGISVIMNIAPKELDSIATIRTESKDSGVAEAIGKLFFQ